MIELSGRESFPTLFFRNGGLMHACVDINVNKCPFRVLVMAKHMLNEVDDVHLDPSKHMFDFDYDDDEHPNWKDPQEVDPLLQKELGISPEPPAS